MLTSKRLDEALDVLSRFLKAQAARRAEREAGSVQGASEALGIDRSNHYRWREAEPEPAELRNLGLSDVGDASGPGLLEILDAIEADDGGS